MNTRIELVEQSDGKWTMTVNGAAHPNLSLHTASLAARTQLTEWSKAEIERSKPKEQK